ncbi:MAG: polysaccharide biosynthesis/export family protein [Xenophilus sp.]
MKTNALFGWRGGLLVVLLVLQGCAAAPGFNDVPASLAPPAADSEKPVEGAITPITPELILAQRASHPRAPGDDVRRLLGKPEPYRIGPGDVLGITVYDHPELTSSFIPPTTVADPASVAPAPGFVVSDTGQMSFPYVGLFKAEGMTAQEVENRLKHDLARVYKNPEVSVRIQAFRSRRVFVEGEVRTPGLQVFTDIPMTLPEVISRAGGILSTGDRSAVMLTRGGASTMVDMVGMAEAGLDPTRIPLQSGDIVFVRSREERKVIVAGEVVKPSAVLMRNGRLSLGDALGEVGGVDLGTANPRQIYVVRNEPAGGQKIFHLDARTPSSLALADGFDLAPKDLVYVDPVGLVRWSRIINLILPSAQGAYLVRDTYK